MSLVLAVCGALGSAAWLLVPMTPVPPSGLDGEPLAAAEIAAAEVVPGASAPAAGGADEVHQVRGRTSPDQFRHWADLVATRTEVPARALRAYGNADMTMRQEKPGCKLTWVTLAGIGRVESNHGRFGNATLGDDGRPNPPIIGIALDGSPGVKAIPDSDGGELDRDKVHDRAVGPMQFIPSTWRKYAADGDGDGRSDPQDIDDAALAAARYLCAGGRDMSTGKGWWEGLFSYNRSQAYGKKVFGLSDIYARSSKG